MTSVSGGILVLNFTVVGRFSSDQKDQHTRGTCGNMDFSALLLVVPRVKKGCENAAKQENDERLLQASRTPPSTNFVVGPGGVLRV
jgi:hypothetical protein